METGTEPNDLVRSVSRALRVLEAVSGSEQALPVKAIARRCGLNVSTTYHLARTLAYEGYLVRDQDGCYLAGEEVARRHRDVAAALRRPAPVHQVLLALSAATGHSAYLARFVAGRIVVSDVVEGPASPHLEDLEVGLPAAAHATALGKALLATLPRQTRRAYLADQGMPRFTGRTVTSADDLDGSLPGVAPGRPVVELGEFRPNVACAAALVPRPGDEGRWWAVGVSARDAPVDGAVVRRLLVAGADLAAPAPPRPRPRTVPLHDHDDFLAPGVQ